MRLQPLANCRMLSHAPSFQYNLNFFSIKVYSTAINGVESILCKPITWISICVLYYDEMFNRFTITINIQFSLDLTIIAAKRIRKVLLLIFLPFITFCEHKSRRVEGKLIPLLIFAILFSSSSPAHFLRRHFFLFFTFFSGSTFTHNWVMVQWITKRSGLKSH